MTASPTVTGTRLVGGVWEGVVTGTGDARPQIAVTHQEQPVPQVTLTRREANGDWVLRVPVPAAAIADGVHTVLIQDAVSGETLDSITLVAGEALANDIRAEMELLRAELDMLKRAFRRHCLETA